MLAHPRRSRISGIATLAAIAVLAPAASAEAAPQFGAWNPGEPYSGSLARTEALQAATKRRVDIVHYFQRWGGPPSKADVQDWQLSAITTSGRTPLLTWEPTDEAGSRVQPAYSLALIAAGAHDDYITRFARDLRDLGSTVYLRPMHEMNGNWYPWGVGVSGNTPPMFVAAWRHMHDIFTAQGATNVKWVWSVNNFDVSPLTPMEQFYPGHDVVDVLAADGYNWGDVFGGWQSFSQAFSSAYSRLSAIGPQPIWITEVGSAPGPGDKAAWVKDMFARADTMDRLKAIVWFNEDKERDWRADGTATTAAAFDPAGVPIIGPILGGGPIIDLSPIANPILGGVIDLVNGIVPGHLLGPDRSADGGGGGELGAEELASGSSILEEATVTKPRLRILATETVRSGRVQTIRWTTSIPTAERKRIRRWTVDLDGHRRCTIRVRPHGPQRCRQPMVKPGDHHWKVVGRDAKGKAVVAAERNVTVLEA